MIFCQSNKFLSRRAAQSRCRFQNPDLCFHRWTGITWTTWSSFFVHLFVRRACLTTGNGFVSNNRCGAKHYLRDDDQTASHRWTRHRSTIGQWRRRNILPSRTGIRRESIIANTGGLSETCTNQIHSGTSTEIDEETSSLALGSSWTS